MNQAVFLSFLQPIAGRFADSSVNEIRINPNGSIYEERNGLTSHVDIRVDAALIEFAVGSLSGYVNKPLNERFPKLDVRLDDGSRVAILAPPIVPNYALTIRRFPQAFTLQDFIVNGTVTDKQAGELKFAILDPKTMLISGATGSGKTTLARTLLNLIQHPGERLVLIEDPAELSLAFSETRDILSMEVREGSPDTPAFTATDALKAALRHSPDRIILGELRGGEAAVFLEALNTGHHGSMTTLHANSAEDAFARLITLVRRGDPTLPRDVIVDTISRSIDVVCHVAKQGTKRVVTELLEVTGISADHSRILTAPLT